MFYSRLFKFICWLIITTFAAALILYLTGKISVVIYYIMVIAIVCELIKVLFKS